MSETRFEYISEDLQVELRAIASKVCRLGCGILAADETPLAMQDRFKHLNIENTPENRRKYRQLLFSCPKEKLSSLSATILQHETLYQTSDDGVPIIQLVKDLGIVPGITLDKGWVPINEKGEVFTQGLDGLDDRCKEYKKLGAEFAKWRMVVSIGEDTPTLEAIKEGAKATAMYAKIAQRNGLVPIVEPDISRAGNHSAQRNLQVTEVVLAEVYKALADYHIYLEGTLLKPNMVTSGTKCEKQADPETAGKLTMMALARHVPPAVPGIFFLSGGLSESQSTDYLRAVNKDDSYPRPWQTSFCFGRALQDSCRSAWLGQQENVIAAQEAFMERVKANGQAALGQ